MHSVCHRIITRSVRVAGPVRFEPTTGSVEWQRIASVNVSKVEREGDLQTLKQFLPEIAVGNIDEHDIDANPGLINAYRLAQLQAQYVLHCQQVELFFCGALPSAGWWYGQAVGQGTENGGWALKPGSNLTLDTFFRASEIRYRVFDSTQA